MGAGINAQRAATEASNSIITTRITEAPTIVDEVSEVVIDEERDSEGETNPLVNEVNVIDIEIEKSVVV